MPFLRCAYETSKYKRYVSLPNWNSVRERVSQATVEAHQNLLGKEMKIFLHCLASMELMRHITMQEQQLLFQRQYSSGSKLTTIWWHTLFHRHALKYFTLHTGQCFFTWMMKHKQHMIWNKGRILKILHIFSQPIYISRQDLQIAAFVIAQRS